MKKRVLNDLRIKKIVITSVLSVLTCVSTMVIQIPSPMNGYVNLGDCMVLTDGILLSPVWSWFAAGVGSMLADILSGYMYYAPGTLVIKSAMVLVFSFFYNILKKQFSFGLSFICSSLISELIMVVGYFIYSSLFLGNGLSAAASIPGNLIQGIFGIISAFVLYRILGRTKTKIEF